MTLAHDVYTLSSVLPAEEKFGLIAQMRRSAISIASNIAEGSQRRTNKDFNSFITIARGSLAELETQILLATQLFKIGDTLAEPILYRIEELSKMLRAFSATLKAPR